MSKAPDAMRSACLGGRASLAQLRAKSGIGGICPYQNFLAACEQVGVLRCEGRSDANTGALAAIGRSGP